MGAREVTRVVQGYEVPSLFHGHDMIRIFNIKIKVFL